MSETSDIAGSKWEILFLVHIGNLLIYFYKHVHLWKKYIYIYLYSATRMMHRQLTDGISLSKERL